jgi:hypothetical protein
MHGFTPESNLEAGRRAAFELLQSLRAATIELRDAERRLRAVIRRAGVPAPKEQLAEPAEPVTAAE